MRNNVRYLKLLALLSPLFLWASSASAAGTANATITTTAAMAAYCQLTTVTNMDFGTINPTTTDPTADATLNLSCTKGTTIQSLIPTMTTALSNGTDTMLLNKFDWKIAAGAFSGTFTDAAITLTNSAALTFSNFTARLVTLRGKLLTTDLNAASAGTYNGAITLTINYQ